MQALEHCCRGSQVPACAEGHSLWTRSSCCAPEMHTCPRCCPHGSHECLGLGGHRCVPIHFAQRRMLVPEPLRGGPGAELGHLRSHRSHASGPCSGSRAATQAARHISTEKASGLPVCFGTEPTDCRGNGPWFLSDSVAADF